MAKATLIGAEKARRKILAIGTVLNRPKKIILASEARLIAVSFAKSAQPFGTGAAAQKAGRAAIARDIYKVYVQPKHAFKDLLGVGGDDDLAQAFWKYYRLGQIEKANTILRKYGRTMRGLPVRAFDGGAAHAAARDHGDGRVHLGRPQLLTADISSLLKYIEKDANKAGFAKGAWADVARALGSVRGIKTSGDIGAGWITRKGKGTSPAPQWNADESQISISSGIDYADRILTPAARSEALSIARNRMIKSLKIAVREEAKKLNKS